MLKSRSLSLNLLLINTLGMDESKLFDFRNLSKKQKRISYTEYPKISDILKNGTRIRRRNYVGVEVYYIYSWECNTSMINFENK